METTERLNYLPRTLSPTINNCKIDLDTKAWTLDAFSAPSLWNIALWLLENPGVVSRQVGVDLLWGHTAGGGGWRIQGTGNLPGLPLPQVLSSGQKQQASNEGLTAQM